MANGSQPKKRSVAVWLIPLLIGIFTLLFLCVVCTLVPVTFYFIRGKGQPATIIPPKSSDGTAGTSVPIPANLVASAGADSINLTWSQSSGAVSKYRVYRSQKIDTGYSALGDVAAPTATYADKAVSKGITYYYVVTALSAAGAESANSKAASSIIDAPPLVPEGVYSWNDVKARATADPKYLALLTEVTKLTMTDVNRLAGKEKQGQTFKRTLPQGTIVTNSTSDYQILPDYTLKTDREALTDEDGTPHVLTRCGNPMKLQALPPPAIIQWTQTIVTTFYWNVVVVVLPQSTLIDLVTTQLPSGPTPEGPGTKLSEQIIGQWSAQDVPEGFPINMTFDAGGGVSTTVHIGTPGMEDFTFSGSYQFTDENHIVIRDSITGTSWTYEVSISDDVLKLSIEGSTVSFRRLR